MKTKEPILLEEAAAVSPWEASPVKTQPAHAGVERARSWSLLLLFSAVYFAIVSCLLIVVLREVSAGAAKPPRPYMSATHPRLWENLFGAWRFLSAPTRVLDEAADLAGVKLKRWPETNRILVQCAFCGFVWGAATYVVYLLGRGFVILLTTSRRARRLDSPQLPRSVPEHPWRNPA